MAAGKGRGQEAVWRSQCKPSWWDSVCPHPWKNPTANPKDSKDTLKIKFECLVQRLRTVGQLPREMQEEIELWEADQKPKVFLRTYLSSLLGQTSNLHSLVEETCHRMKESGISVDVSVVNDLQSCLTASFDQLESIKNPTEKRNQKENIPRASRYAGNKRPHCETDSDGLSHPSCKQPKRSPVASPSLSSSSTVPTPSLAHSPLRPLSSTPQPTLTSSPRVSDPQVSPDHSKMLLAALQKQLLQKQSAKTAGVTPSICQGERKQTLMVPTAHPFHPVSSREKGGKKMVQDNISPAGEATVTVVSSACLPASVPQHSLPDEAETPEFRDFLELDLDGGDDVDGTDCQILNDCQFFDSLLQESPIDISVNVNSAVSSCSVSQIVPGQSPASLETSLAHNDEVKHSHHDPMFGQTLPQSDLSENSPYPFGFSEAEAEAAGRQAEGEQGDGCFGTAHWSGVGDMDRGLQDTEMVSESGYSSESSAETSHRTSLDSETPESILYSDLDSPDLEAYLESLET